MRVLVLQDVCQGHTLCAMTAPEVFSLREEDGHAEVVAAEVPEAYADSVERAALGCPERAIVIE